MSSAFNELDRFSNIVLRDSRPGAPILPISDRLYITAFKPYVIFLSLSISRFIKGSRGPNRLVSIRLDPVNASYSSSKTSPTFSKVPMAVAIFIFSSD